MRFGWGLERQITDECKTPAPGPRNKAVYDQTISQRFYDEELASLDLRGKAVIEIGSGEGELLTILRDRPDRPARLVGVNAESIPPGHRT